MKPKPKLPQITPRQLDSEPFKIQILYVAEAKHQWVTIAFDFTYIYNEKNQDVVADLQVCKFVVFVHHINVNCNAGKCVYSNFSDIM